MKKLLGIFAVGVFAMNVSACGVASVVDDINDAVKTAAEQAKVETAFGQAITGVTFASLGAAMDAALTDLSAAPALRAQSYAPFAAVDTTTTNDEGGTVTTKGTVTVTVAETVATVEVDLTSTFSGPVKLSDGTSTVVSGDSKVTGTATVSNVDGKISASFDFKNVGTIKVDGKSYAFDVQVVWTSETNLLTITGKVNGNDMFPQTVTIDLKLNEENQQVEGAHCLRADNDICVAYSTNEFTCSDLAEQEEAEYSEVTDCAVEFDWSYSCTIPGHSVQYTFVNDEAGCTGKGGTWEALNVVE